MDITLDVFWKITATTVFVAAVLSAVVEWAAPGSDPIIATAAMVFGCATWGTPFFAFAIHAWQDRGRTKPPLSLAVAGRVVGIVVSAAFFSLFGLALGLVSVIFGQGSRWAWLALLAIVAFWIFGLMWVGLGSARRT